MNCNWNWNNVCLYIQGPALLSPVCILSLQAFEVNQKWNQLTAIENITMYNGEMQAHGIVCIALQYM